MKKLIQFELRKIFSRRLTQIALIVLVFLSVFLGILGYQNKYAFDAAGHEGTGKTAVEIDKEIADRYEGLLTDKKVQQMMSEFTPKSDLHGMNAVYIYQNAMQSAAFARFSDMNGQWNGSSVSDIFGNEEIRIGYVDGWLTSSQNMAKVFIMLSCVIAVMIAPVYCREYSGVDNIILTSKYGRTKCGEAKIYAGMIAAFTVTFIVVALNILLALILYGSDGLDCSILFAPLNYAEGYIPFNITCGMLLRYQILLAFTGAMSVAGITLLVSAISKNQMIAVVVAAALYFLPAILPVSEASPLFRLIGLLPLYHAQFISLMSVDQMSSGLLYAVWAAPAAVVFIACGTFVSRKIFAKHQVV